MVKIDLDVEKVENGWILCINKTKYACTNPRAMMRRILDAVEGRVPITRKEIGEKVKDFWKDKIGILEKDILVVIEKTGYSTADKLTEELAKNYPIQPKWQTRGAIKNVLTRLVKKGYLKRGGHKNSKKYYLTEKRPVCAVATGPKRKEVN